jgi:hypothetical protein
MINSRIVKGVPIPEIFWNVRYSKASIDFEYSSLSGIVDAISIDYEYDFLNKLELKINNILQDQWNSKTYYATWDNEIKRFMLSKYPNGANVLIIGGGDLILADMIPDHPNTKITIVDPLSGILPKFVFRMQENKEYRLSNLKMYPLTFYDFYNCREIPKLENFDIVISDVSSPSYEFAARYYDENLLENIGNLSSEDVCLFFSIDPKRFKIESRMFHTVQSLDFTNGKILEIGQRK